MQAKDLKVVAGGIIDGFRFGKDGQLSGLVIKKDNKKVILRVVSEVKGRAFWRRVTKAYLDIEEYW